MSNLLRANGDSMSGKIHLGEKWDICISIYRPQIQYDSGVNDFL